MVMVKRRNYYSGKENIKNLHIREAIILQYILYGNFIHTYFPNDNVFRNGCQYKNLGLSFTEKYFKPRIDDLLVYIVYIYDWFNSKFMIPSSLSSSWLWNVPKKRWWISLLLDLPFVLIKPWRISSWQAEQQHSNLNAENK